MTFARFLPISIHLSLSLSFTLCLRVCGKSRVREKHDVRAQKSAREQHIVMQSSQHRQPHIAYSFYTVFYYSLCRLRNSLSLTHIVLQYFTTVCVDCVALSLTHTHSYAIFTTYRSTHSIFISIQYFTTVCVDCVTLSLSHTQFCISQRM